MKKFIFLQKNSSRKMGREIAEIIKNWKITVQNISVVQKKQLRLGTLFKLICYIGNFVEKVETGPLFYSLWIAYP